MLLKLEVDYEYALQAMTHYCDMQDSSYVMSLSNKSWFGVVDAYAYKNLFSITFALNEMEGIVYLHIVVGGAVTGMLKSSDYRFSKKHLNKLLKVLAGYDLGYEIMDVN